MAERRTLVRLVQLSKSFGGKAVLDGVTLSIRAKEIVAILGPNGSGKSTLLRLIAGLSPATQGVRQVVALPLKVGYVSDRFPKLRLTPREYLMHMGRLQGMPRNILAKRIEELMSQFDMDDAFDQRMTNFSKGMLQKVNIVQAILGQPDLLLMDEPLSGLDQESQYKLIALCQDLKQNGTAIVMTFHESTLLQSIADRVITLRGGVIVSDTAV